MAYLDKHSLDFSEIADFGWKEAIILPSRAGKHGGVRSKAVGYFRDGAAVVIFSLLGTEAVSVISFRPANKKEKRLIDEKS